MKLDCALVNDLYVLYQENELSPAVKDALEAHLKDCPDCCRLYETGSGFTLPEAAELEPPKKLDEKIMLRLKIRKLQAAVLVILLIFAVTSVQSYANTRSHLFVDLNHLEQPLWQLHGLAGNVKQENFQAWELGYLVEQINDKNSTIRRSLNMFEQRTLPGSGMELFLNPHILTLLDRLHARSMAETWTERDEVVLNRLSELFRAAVELLTAERLALFETPPSTVKELLHQVDILSLAQIYEEINLLYLTYYKYNQLPEEASLLPEEELKGILSDLFPAAGPFELRGRELAAVWGEIIFESRDEDNPYYGKIDPYTGDLFAFRQRGAELRGPLLDREEVEAKVAEALTRIHPGYTIEFEFLGRNHNFDSNVDIQLYTWQVYFALDGIRLDNSITVYADARTGLIDMYNTERGPVRKPDPSYSTEILFDKDSALATIELGEGETSPIFEGTVLIRSALTGHLQPAHKFRSNYNVYFINTILGKADSPVH